MSDSGLGRRMDIILRSPTEMNIAKPDDPYSLASCSKEATPPAPVDLLTATVNDKKVTLTWEDKSTDETGFRVERKTPSSAWTSIATPTANATSYNDTGLAADTYFYRVFAVNANSDSISSSEVQAIVE